MNDFYNLFQSTKFLINMAGYLNVGTEWKSMVPDFKYVRIYYVRRGGATLELTDGPYELKEGNLYFFPAFSILSGSCESEMGHYFIHLIPDVFTEHFFQFLTLKREFPLQKETADYLFTQVVMNYSGDSIYQKIATDSSLRLIFSYFFIDPEKTFYKTDFTKFICVFNYIDQHINEQIQLKDLSDLMFMNKVYFSNLFKKAFGLSP